MLKSKPLPLPTLDRVRASIPALSAVVMLSACAQLPHPQDLPEIRSSEAWGAKEAYRAPQGEWPVDKWWTSYGDHQLNALIDEALQDAPDMAAANARLKRAEAFMELAGSSLKPQVSANASLSTDKLSYNHLIPRSPATEGWNDYGRVTLDFRWEIDFWGKNRAGLSAATSEMEARRAEQAQARLMLTSGIAFHYAELSRLFANRELAVKAVAIRQKTAQLFAERQANGLENKGSVRAADAGLAAAEGALLAADEQVALQRNRLAALLGKGPDRGLTIEAPQLKLSHSYGLPDELSVDLLGRRPDVVAARLMAQAQASRIHQKQAEFYPNINLSAFFGVQSLGLDMLTKSGSSVGSVGPAVSLPIFNGGRLRGELCGAQAAYAESVAQYNATVTRALQDVADAAVSQKALGQRLNKAQDAVDAATEAHRVARNRYEGGLASYLEVLSAEDNLLGNLGQQTNLRAQSYALDIALNRALGGGYQVTLPATHATR